MGRADRPHCSRAAHRFGRRAFTLVELVIVVVIIGVIAAIAVPRFSQATASATATFIEASINTVEKAMAHYYAEHGRYPGYNPANGSPNDDAFTEQLLTYTDETGNYTATRGRPYIYGPYLRPPFPKNPFNKLDTVKVIQDPDDAYAEGSTGWVAVLSTGEFGINATAAQIDKVPIDPDKIIIKGGGGALPAI